MEFLIAVLFSLIALNGMLWLGVIFRDAIRRSPPPRRRKNFRVPTGKELPQSDSKVINLAGWKRRRKAK